MDQLVAALAAAQHKRFYKASTSAKAVGTWVSFWKVAREPGAGSNPATGTGEVPTSLTQGAISWSNPSGANCAYLARHQAMGTTQSGILVLADRLFHMSRLVGNVATVQNVNSLALTRPDSTGDNNELVIEWYTATGSSQVNITIAYTNQTAKARRASRIPTLIVPAEYFFDHRTEAASLTELNGRDAEDNRSEGDSKCCSTHLDSRPWPWPC